MDLNKVLEAMETPEQTETQTKVASAPQETKLAEALKVAATAPAPEAAPVAAEGDVVDDLMKMASELAGTEKEAELAHAALMGQAFADAAITKIAQYEQSVTKVAATAEPLKTAAFAPVQAVAGGTYTEDQLKEAAEHGYKLAQQEMAQEGEAREKLAAAAETMSQDALVKFAAENGMTPVLEKMAAEYQQGYKQAMENAQQEATMEFLKGAAEVEILVKQAQAAQAAQQ